MDAQRRARALVRFWHSRQWLPAPAPLHVHPLDLVKLEELIAAMIADPDSVNLSISP
jgi:hypothetical protein